MQANCRICSKTEEPAGPVRAPRAPRARAATRRTPKASSGIRVRRMERAPDDGYENLLVHGLRSSVDAARLADELAFSLARLEELRTAPPGLYAAAAADPDLLFLIAYVSPGRGGDPWSAVSAARAGAWDKVAGGPRTAHDPARGAATVEAWRVWAERHGPGAAAALTGDADWEPGRRFARTFERLTLPGLPRGPKYDFLVTADALGVARMEAGTLAIGRDATDPVVMTAKRVLGIGDAVNLERRAAELAKGTGVPFAALDLALFNLDRPAEERATMGATVAPDPGRRASIAGALGLDGA